MTKEEIKNDKDNQVVIIGGGPAGLTAAYSLCKASVPSVVLEKDSTVGGISRTVNYKGYLFDIGGHRFYTKVKAVDDIWREVLSETEFLRRARLSRIYYNKRFFHYPLRAFEALFKLGLWNSGLILTSYLRARLFPSKEEETFEQWITNRFGKHLYRIFFKTYTEKVWGMPCNKISADWAAQRIKGLTLFSTIKNAFFKPGAKHKNTAIKTLIDEFDYPLKGPGMMWERMAEILSRRNSRIHLNTVVESILWKEREVTGVGAVTDGRRETISGTHFISSMPIRELIRKLSPSAPSEVIEAADQLKYRDFITVALIVNKTDLFPDNWIYIHDKEVKVGRVQNYKNWSKSMVPDETRTCLGLEYFCFEGDGLWTMTNDELINLGKRELQKLGLAQECDVEDGFVVKMPKAYPVYDSQYHKSLRIIRNFVSQFGNLQLIGRNGMHKYNNQDHSMLTAMLAVENILGGNHDLWSVNTEQEYYEEDLANQHTKTAEITTLLSTQPKVPKRN
ncbi:MAG TPA: NAD(P)/FAD-dependent oxidoreductase [Pyrinomonadaceae bacterium]|jgi:protoporphyrinogen oxidase